MRGFLRRLAPDFWPAPRLTVTLPCRLSVSLACSGLLSGAAPRPNIAPAPCRDLAVHLTQTSPSMAACMGCFPKSVHGVGFRNASTALFRGYRNRSWGCFRSGRSCVKSAREGAYFSCVPACVPGCEPTVRTNRANVAAPSKPVQKAVSCLSRKAWPPAQQNRLHHP